eukprot:SAG31_NODE_2281_length_6022_cov_3.327706_1_plen_69_part_00
MHCAPNKLVATSTSDVGTQLSYVQEESSACHHQQSVISMAGQLSMLVLVQVMMQAGEAGQWVCFRLAF